MQHHRPDPLGSTTKPNQNLPVAGLHNVTSSFRTTNERQKSHPLLYATLRIVLFLH